VGTRLPDRASRRAAGDAHRACGADLGTPEFALASNPSLAHDPSVQPQVALFLRLAASPATAAAVIRMLLQLDIRPILPTIRVPTLVMHRRDTATWPIENGRYLAEHIEGAKFVELPGADYGLSLGDVDSVVDEIQEFLTGTPAAIDTDRVLATVLFTDIVGSTERSAELGDQRWRDVLDAHDRLAERQLARYRGTLVKATGDGLVATFDGPARAIWCALALRDGLRSLDVEIRGGVHCGEIERRGPDVSGLAVHMAARVQAEARPGEVLVTRTVKDLVAGAQIAFVDRGPYALKGVPDEWQLFSVGEG
jgi:class 3 adenylate cyclase